MAALPFAVLWDMDGTLVDTGELHFHAWVRVCREHGREFTRQDFQHTFGQRNPEIIHYLFNGAMDGAASDRFALQKEMYYRTEARKTGIDLLPGVHNLLTGLKALGARQAVGSSAPRGNLDLILELTGIDSFMDTLVTMEDTQRGKPDPEVFLIGAERLKVSPSRSVVVEDAVAGIQAARAGGMKSIAVRFVAHHSAEKLKEAGADRVVESLEEMTPGDFLDMVGG